MRFRLALRSFALAAVSLGLFMGLAGVAHANPADLHVTVGFQPWNSNKTQPMPDVNLKVDTVPIANKVPILGNPYNGNHLMPGCFIFLACNTPTTNSFNFNLNTWSGTGVQPNPFCVPASSCSLSTVYMSKLAWCGVNYYGPGNMAPGEFRMQVTVAPLGSPSPNGGRWVGYWQWADKDPSVAPYAATLFDGNSAAVPANNNNISTVAFTFYENPPPRPSMTVQGYKVDAAGNPNGAYKDAAVSLDYALTSTSNPYSFSGITADENHIITAATVPGYEVVGYCLDGCVNPTPGTAYNYTANTIANGGALNLWWYYKRDIATTVTTNSCSTVAARVATGFTNMQVQLKLGDITIPGVQTAPDVSFTIPNEYRDGVVRPISLIYTYAGGNQTVALGINHSCERAASCSNLNTSTAFSSDNATAGTDVIVQVTMLNPNDSSRYAHWRSAWPDGSANQLTFTPSALAAGWKNDANSSFFINGKQRTDTNFTAVKPGESNTFFASVTVPSNPAASTIDIQFQMAFISNSGRVQYGDICTRQVTIRNQYTPWLRVQNGSVAALKDIVGQEPSGRGGRDGVGVDQDMNLEATNAVTSVTKANNFCSSNAYNFARTDPTLAFTRPGISGGVVSNCASGSYVFKPSNIFDSAGSEHLYSTVSGLMASSGQCNSAEPTHPNPSNPATRYFAAGSWSSSTSTINAAGKCPTIYTLTGANSTINPTAQLRVTGGRVTLLVNGNLTINKNIINDYSAAFGGTSLDVAPSLAASPNQSQVAQMINLQNTNLNRIPNLGIVVSGNVTIANSVTQLDAMIYADGKISTCDAYTDGTSIGPKSTGLVDLSNAQKCNKRLVVRGGLYALNGFQFGRNFYDAVRIGGKIGISGSEPWKQPDFDTKGNGSIAAEGMQGYYSGGAAEDILGSGLSIVSGPPGFDNLNTSKYSQPIYQKGDFSPKF